MKGGAEAPFFVAPKLYGWHMRTLLVLLTLLLPNAAFAADPLPPAATEVMDIPPGPDSIIVLQQGEKAPYSGQLYSNDTAFRWASWLLQYKRQLTSRAELDRKLCTADLSLAATKLRLEIEKHDALMEDAYAKLDSMDEENDKLRHPPFYKSTWFGFTLGVLVTGAAVVATAVAVH